MAVHKIHALMPPIKCLIVEDEPIAAEILEDYIRQVPFLELVGVCTDAIYAMQAMQQHPVGLLFLDIHLPRLKGLDFLRTLANPPAVIITTAYHQYALEGYSLNVVDYLLKPIEFSRFLQAANKVALQHPGPVGQGAVQQRPYRFFNTNKRQVKVFLDEILYVESLKEYARIATPGKEVVVKYQIGALEGLLKEAGLMRIHRSYLAALHKIEAYTATEVEIGGRKLPVGRSYRELVGRALEAL